VCVCVCVWVPSVADIRNVWSYMPSPPFAFMTCSETKCAKFIALWSSVIFYDSNGRFQIRFYWLNNLRLWTFAGSSALLLLREWTG